ncbi:MAG: catalase, partial [Acetatifactor sp.]|nr:catalase [Acetatifactor sp.]
MGNAWNHFKTISYHKYLVAMGCFRVGLYKQGILHDLSKYSPTEFRVGMRYYQGTRSPNDAERELLGYSSAWLHHKGRNRHHFEYWVDYSGKKPGETRPVPMPGRYIAEMIMDRIAACKIYKGKDYTDSAPYEYYLKGKNNRMMHQDT